MSVIFRIYRDTTLTDQDLGDLTVFTLGSGKKDLVQMSDCGFAKKQLAFVRGADCWQWTSTRPVPVRNSAALSGTLQLGDVLLIDREKRIAVTVLERDENDTRLFDLSRASEVTVGRSAECDIVVACRQVSGRHLTLCRGAEGWIVRDLNSSNGTYRNGERTRESALTAGDVLDLGPCRLLLTGDSLSVAFRGGVKSNLSDARPERTAQSPEDPYPFLFHRSPRLKEDMPAETIELQDAPAIGGKPSISWFSVIVPPLLSVGVMALASFLMGGALTMLVFSAPMTLVGILMSVVSYRRQVKEYRRMEQLRLDKYDEYLDEQEQVIRNAQCEQRRILTDVHPATIECLSIASQPARRLWERRRTDADFLELRVGEGAIESCVNFQVPRHGLSLVKDDQEDRPGELAERYAWVPHCPITCPLGQMPTCGLIGERESVLTAARNMLVQAATHHSYEDLRIVLIFSGKEADRWSFVRWLPHVYNETRTERYIADSPDSARRVLGQLNEMLAARVINQDKGQRENVLPEGPHFLVVCADRTLLEHHPIGQYLTANDPRLGISTLFLYDELELLPKECSIILELKGRKGSLFYRENAGARREFALDGVKEEFYDSFARTLAPLCIEAAAGKGNLPTTVSFLQGCGVRSPGELPGPKHWPEAVPEKSMAVPIGVRASGEPFFFDIHEKKCGPHGLVAGMTGSGKSEMVQSWILSMALAFPPQAVSFVLIDFKGTGLILPFRNLPHLAGTISDLDTNITRNLIALENELTRRKALLDAASVSNISGYLRLYREGKVKEPLSYLFLVIDEFAEFKVQFPEFMQVVNRVFAIGRTLGVHIILLTQKPGSVVDDKMNANTRFRWCLKVASSADSQEMLRHPDAARITNPGRAYVQVGEDEVYEEIQSYWSGAPYNPNRALSRQREDKLSVVDLYGFKRCYEPEKTTGFRADKNEIDAVVEYLDQYARDNGVPRARNIWTSRLPEHIELPQLLHIAFDGERWGKNEGLAPVVGMLDDPRTQSQYPLRLDLPRDGHTVVYGAPGVGKTTFLQTFILSAALAYSPEEVEMYLLDFGGGSLNLFRQLPHVGAVVRDSETERLEKVCGIISSELSRRKALFAEMGIVSIGAFREVSEEPMPYLVLAVDNFGPVLNLYPDLDEFFRTLTQEGGSYGIFLVATAGSENAVPYRIAQNLKGSVALRMPDASDYASIVGRTEGLEPENFPGRGLFRGKPPLEFQTALPTDGGNESERARQIRQLAQQMDSKWTGLRPEDVPVMPARVLAGEWSADGILLGLDRKTVRPAAINLMERQFLLVSYLGGVAGKQLLRAIAGQLPGCWPTEKIALYDPGERVLEKQKDSCGYITSPAEFDGYIASLMPLLQKRKESAETLEGKAWLESQLPIVLVISDLRACLEAASADTTRRLASILHLGAGLRVSVVVLARAQDREDLSHAGDMFSIHLTNKADVVMVEGCLRDHGMFDTQLDYTEAGESLAEGDAWLLQNGEARLIKCVEQA